jgi:predicted kinase
MKSFRDILLEEEQSAKHHVMTFGRMNPPTTGHLKLIDKVKDVAKKHNASHSVVVSHSQDTKKNPLSGSQKVKHLSRYSPGTHFEKSSKEHPSIFHHVEKLHKKGVTHLHVVVGSDRVKEFKHNLEKYNGKPNKEGHVPYHFKKITVHSAGHRDPDAEGSEGMSGTKMRGHAKSSNFHEFRKGVPAHVSATHAKELMHDTRKGMGLHESHNRGMFRAIFVTGGPGSGKDIIIREAIAESKAVELNATQAFDYLADKQKLSEKSTDYRRESIRNRGPLIINSPADAIEKISYIKEELEELGYSTLMVFVDTTNQASQERNSRLTRMMAESIRQEKWLQAQNNKNIFLESFENVAIFDNSGSIESVEENITDMYHKINSFIDTEIYNVVSESWLKNNNRLNINEKFNLMFKEEKNVEKINRFSKIKTGGPRADGPDDISPDNRAGDSNSGSVKWNAPKRTKTYTFGAGPGTYAEETKKPSIKIRPAEKESNFSQDKEKLKRKRFSDSPTQNQRMRNTTGIGPEYDTRQQGTVYPMSGLGDVTYREQKDFKKFRSIIGEFNGFQNDVESGVGGTLSGSDNKEPMQTYKDIDKNLITVINKKKKKQEK